MCGRYTLIAKAEEIKDRFDTIVPDGYKARYNAAPTQILPIITSENPEGFSFFHCGLMANMAKNKSISTKLINTMAETINEKPSFKNALKTKRCLVPADGFYEWKSLGKKTKVPYRVTLLSKELFSFAGLWEEFEDNDGEMIHTFTIITTKANSFMAPLNDRMPVILPKSKERVWLDDSVNNDDHLKLLQPFDPKKMDMYTVSPMVNNIANDNPSLIKNIPSADQFGNYTLFG